jgi:hypothetical protein
MEKTKINVETTILAKECKDGLDKAPKASELTGKAQPEQESLKGVKEFLEGNVGQSAWLVVLLSLAYYMQTISDRWLGLIIASASVTFASIILVELWDQLYSKPQNSRRFGLLRRLMALTLPFLIGYLHLRYRSAMNNILYAEIGAAAMVILGVIEARKRINQHLDTTVKNGKLKRLVRAFVLFLISTLFFPVAYGINRLLDSIAPYSYWTGLVLAAVFVMACLHIVASLLIEKMVPYIDGVNQ